MHTISRLWTRQKRRITAGYQAGFKVGSENVFQCLQAPQWTLYCYNSHVCNSGIHPSLGTSLILFQRHRSTLLWMDCMWPWTALCSKVHGRHAISCACSLVQLVQVKVTLYFCCCNIEPQKKFCIVFIAALAHMYLYWAFHIQCSMCGSWRLPIVSHPVTIFLWFLSEILSLQNLLTILQDVWWDFEDILAAF
jgi:hypothetical protein